MKDLYFVNEGCATVIPSNGHLNFDKFNRLGQRLSEFAQWKNVECPYDKLSAIADFLQCYPIYSEEGKLLERMCYPMFLYNMKVQYVELEMFSKKFQRHHSDL